MKYEKPNFDLKIDLHGLTTMQAFYKTIQTIKDAYSGGLRNLLFITGIGDPVKGTGAIRAEFQTYCQHPEVENLVAQVTYAHGTYLVIIRKKREN